MKKSFWNTAVFILYFSLLCLTACSRKNNILQSSSKNETEPAAQNELSSQNEPSSQNKPSAPKIDYDLSNMNYNMISAITFEMLVEPEKYTDKSVKISGQFYSEVYEGKRYYSVIIWDATLCCPAGLDFIPPEGFEFPQDFPALEENITVIGKMQENPETGDLIYVASSIEV